MHLSDELISGCIAPKRGSWGLVNLDRRSEFLVEAMSSEIVNEEGRRGFNVSMFDRHLDRHV